MAPPVDYERTARQLAAITERGSGLTKLEQRQVAAIGAYFRRYKTFMYRHVGVIEGIYNERVPTVVTTAAPPMGGASRS
jgi:hypothetical protein